MPAGRTMPDGVGVGVAATVGACVGLLVGDELLPPHWTTAPSAATAERMRTAVRFLNYMLLWFAAIDVRSAARALTARRPAATLRSHTATDKSHTGPAACQGRRRQA